jgi:hypothetical protein
MLPECRTYGEHYPIRKISIEKRDVKEFRQELCVNIKVMMGDDVSGTICDGSLLGGQQPDAVYANLGRQKLLE